MDSDDLEPKAKYLSCISVTMNTQHHNTYNYINI